MLSCIILALLLLPIVCMSQGARVEANDPITRVEDEEDDVSAAAIPLLAGW